MRIPLLFAATLLAGCTSLPSPSPEPAASTPSGLPVVAEAWRSAVHADAGLDSLASWPTPDGGVWLIATAKQAHQLQVFDAESGAALRTVGTHGVAPGQFDRPNGVAIHGDLVFVAERDNHRIQVLALPTFTPVTVFGAPDLRSPYGLWVHETAPDTLEIHVTDNWMDGPDHTRVPDIATLDQRVRRYRLEMHDDAAPTVTPLGPYGATDPETALRIVESIAGDPAHDRLLIADEDLRHRATLHDYSLDGVYSGRALPAGTFIGEPEGVALWSCSVDGGYWVAADQLRPRTVFRVFTRNDLAPAGSFTGAQTAATDGIALHAAASTRFPAGALFAVDDDAAVVAFDLRDIAALLQLDPDCTR